MNKSCTCIECSNDLHSYTQQCGPYLRDDAGELVATGRMTLVECRNPECGLYYVTASLKMYNHTVGKFIAARSKAQAVSHV